ncbi:FAD-dependent oxidoreductase [Candidatus Gracilibacteria bacterium]|nr:FAD-dependent oxidoreductase [Candidatus Gracilibacteria bacterium]
MLSTAVYRRWGLTGLLSGVLSGALLLPSHSGLGFVLGALIGLSYALAFRHPGAALLDAIVSAAALAVPLWAFFDILLLPLLTGQPLLWTLDGVLSRFPALVNWTFFGAALGFLRQMFGLLADRLFGPLAASPQTQPAVTRIVILGGGFAGVTTAQYLEQQFGADPAVALTLVSETNALLFTPMLAEVAGSSLEPTHISHPLRSALRRTTIVRGEVERVDLGGRRVVLTTDERAAQRELPYDHVVFALGAVSNFLGLHNVQAQSFDFKSLLDAIRIRNQVIEMLERADQEPDPLRRQQLLRFVIAGGGFSGAELAGALNDFVRGSLAYYPRIAAAEATIILVHSRDRILPELSAPLAAYALERMRRAVGPSSGIRGLPTPAPAW